MLGVIGGSGFYTFFDSDVAHRRVDTPYGEPSAAVTVGTVGEHEVAFLPRHGASHEFSAHTVPYRANMWALRKLGVRRVFAPVRGGQPEPRLWSGRRGGARPAGGSHQRPCRHLLRLRRHPRRLRRSVLPDVARGGHRSARRGRRRHHGGDPGAAVFHPGRKPVVRLGRVHFGQHDRLPGGGAGPRARNMLCSNRFGDRSGRRHRRRGGREGRRRVRAVRKEHGAVQKAGARGDRPGWRRTRTARTAWRTPASRCPSSCREGAAHRRGRFHRVAGGRGAAGSGPRGRRASTLLLPAAHGPNAVLPPGCRRVDVRDAEALAPLLAWCRPGLSPGRDGGCRRGRRRRARLRRPQRFRHHGAAGADVRRRGAAAGAGVVDGGLRAGRLSSVPEHGSSTRCRAGAPTSTPGSSSTAARSAARSCAGGWSTRMRALRPRSLYAASKTAQEHYALAWAESTGGSVVALRYHNVYGPGMPRDTPYSGVAAIFRSALEKGEPPRVFEDGGQMRDFVHVDDVAAANLAAASSTARRATASRRPMSARGGPSRSWRWPPRCATHATGTCPRWSPGSTAAATCATSSPTRPGRRGAGFPRGGRPARGSARIRVRAAAVRPCVTWVTGVVRGPVDLRLRHGYLPGG